MRATEITATEVPPARGPTAHVQLRPVSTTAALLPVLQLQRLAGNRAVAQLVGSRLSPGRPLAAGVQRQASQPSAGAPACREVHPIPPPTALPGFGNWADPSWIRMEPAPGGLAAIRATDGPGSETLGYTSWPHPEPYMPQLNFVPYQLPNGSWTARLEFTPASRLQLDATFPGPGVHRVDSGTVAEHYVISPQVSDLIRRGEAEHVDDHSYAHLLVSQRISQILYQLTSAPKPQAATSEAALECTWRWFRSALPPELRWDLAAGTGRLVFGWLQRQNTLGGVTMRRDSERWHSMGRRQITKPGEKRGHRIPTGEVGYELLPGRNEIGQHPTEPLVQAQLPSLPTFE
ncbi:MAG: hypothetical protein ACRDS0_10225 [Pseudonocardiaceae bacterium]